MLTREKTLSQEVVKAMSREEADELILRLHAMDTNELTRLWAILFGTVCYTRRRLFIRQRLEWRINTLLSGGISERAMKRAEEIADDTLLRVKSRAFSEREVTPPRAAACPDLLIEKNYKGSLYQVLRKNGVFIYNGQHFATLSEVSSAIAGYYVSGNKFFNTKL